MTTKTKQLTAAAVAELLEGCADQVTKSKGIFTARRGFFYTSGRTFQTLFDEIKEVFPQMQSVDSGEVWKPFKGGASIKAQSHWFVKFTL